MAPRRKNASIKSTGSTSSKAEPLPEWVKNKNIAKPPPKYIQAQQQQQQKQGRASPSLANVAEAPPPRPPPLFPPGTKTPINLLNERIQKHYSSQGWLKPNIDARKVPKQEQQTDTNLLEGEKWTFVVTLVKTNKADQNNPDTVRFDGRDPRGFEGSSVALSSKEEAKHWGATYALFRLFSNLSLYQVLPSGPREYWKKLSNHKANAPDHLNWLWAADPFEAVQKVAMEKEAKKEARLKREEEEVDKGPRLSKAWQEAREVRMAKELRDAVEATVKKALQLYPAEIKSSLRLEAGTSQEEEEEANQDLVASLLKLGFRKGHARSACVWLRQARRGQSTLSASLASISNLGDLDACLEYLTIFCPEEDLPKVFAPSIRADSFVTSSASAGHEEQLAIRWIEDRLVKLAGYPRIAVSKALASMKDLAVQDREAACTDLLLCNLSEIEKVKIDKESVDVNRKTRSDARIEERITLEAILGPERIKIIPTSEKALSGDKMSSEEFYDIVISHVKEDIRLRISPGEKSKYPEKGNGQAVPTFFVASTTLPAYLRLALTRRLGRILFALEDGYDDWKEMIEAGQGGILLAMVEELESCWQSIVDDPPELAMVMKGVTVKAKLTPREDKQNETNGQAKRTIKTVRRPLKISRNAKEDEELKHAQARLWQSFDYKPFASTRNNLPAMASKDTILSLLEKNRILIIAGETGCGKTTQCPQFVLDDFIERGKGSLCNIIVTQPRRLSAMGVASRVSAERCEDLNGQGRVGYAIRGERKAGRQTKLLFSTIGVLLRRLSQHDRNLDGVSHIFVDEVHERGVESDLLLLELREVLRRNSTLRVILMSATIDQETFSRYFDSAPVITIPGRTHPVTDYYLEDVKSLIETFQEDKERTYGIDYNLIGATTKMICERALNMGNLDGAILIFCPGVGEIRLAMDAIIRELRGGSVEVMPLHANLTPEEQRRVFKRTRAGIRKIVVSTNVAETSITIDDVVYVIDVGLVKETRYDPISGLTRLMETRCSRAASKQRRGRAGRVQSGECFKLFSRSTEEQKMEAQQIPEIRRMSLENLILTVKALKGEEDHPAEYLAKAISPPSVAAIEKAMLLLAEMNIITGKNKLTALGKHVSLLPLDVRLAKLLVFGCIFHCLDPILTIASLLSCKPLFAGPYEKREEVSAAKLKFQIGSSDVLTDANAFQQWTMMKKAKASSSEMKKWCEDYFISSSSIRDIASTRIDLLGNLIELGFIPIDYGKDNSSSSYLDTNAVDVNLKKSLLLAGLYPSVVRIVHPKARFDQSSSGAIQRESEAKQVRYFDDTGQRVFLHPSSMLFSQNKYQSEFLTFFAKSVSKSRGGGASDLGEKIYLRDANEVPIFAMLLFGGKMKVHRLQGGISMSCASDQEEGWIKFRASARIATLIQHLRFLLDAALEKSFENPTENVFQQGLEAEVRDCLQRVLDKDGLS